MDTLVRFTWLGDDGSARTVWLHFCSWLMTCLTLFVVFSAHSCFFCRNMDLKLQCDHKREREQTMSLGELNEFKYIEHCYPFPPTPFPGITVNEVLIITLEMTFLSTYHSFNNPAVGQETLNLVLEEEDYSLLYLGIKT